jgi:hypothetical protein
MRPTVRTVYINVLYVLAATMLAARKGLAHRM